MQFSKIRRGGRYVSCEKRDSIVQETTLAAAVDIREHGP